MLMPFRRNALVAVAATLVGGSWFVSAVAAPPAPKAASAIAPATRAALAHISEASLRGHLSFLASDRLEGRASPSPGLDIAAEYIAAQFRRAGLEPAGDDGFFQTAHWRMEEPADAELHLTIAMNGGETLRVDRTRVSVSGSDAVAIANAPVIKLPLGTAEIDKVTPDTVAGAVILTEMLPDPRSLPADQRAEAGRAMFAFLRKLRALHPLLIVSVEPDDTAIGAAQGDPPTARLVDPEAQGQSGGVRSASLRGAEAGKLFDRLPAGRTEAKLSAERPAPIAKPVVLRNVVGILRGSDPALRDTYVLVSAHYDHLGVRPGGTEGKDGTDRIYNGANDDGSGTVSVIELASALATAQPRPRRTIVFMTFFGEERGLLGSRFYSRHPVVPLEKTIAALNLEQMGRTDSTEGPQIGRASLTGFDYSDMGTILTRAGQDTGVTIFKDPVNSDRYFAASDNVSLAAKGVPAHTISVAYEYPDYHGVGDSWEKIDYANMARVDRTVGLAILRMASNQTPPQWNAQSTGAAPFRSAQQKPERK